MTSAATRVALVVVSLCALAWFAHGLRALDLEADGLAATQRAQQHGHLSAAELSAARKDFRDARSFSADQGPLLNEGFLLAANGRRVAAYRTAREVAADEPENMQAWFLARLSAPNRRASDAAQRRLEQLSPFFEAGR